MFLNLIEKIFGSQNDRFLKKLDPIIAAINAKEESYQALSDEALKNKTAEFKAQLAGGTTLDDLLVDAFATVRETARRVLGQRHYDVQLKGGIVLHRGMITEMKTGEGKTLVATLPVYLNALTGQGVHVVTVNDYLAKRDAEWMGQIYRFLGLSVSCVVQGLEPAERREAYAADITYGTNNEFGFDYLRDNMKFRLEERVQRPFAYAIVDEVDSILIDEARTPLIISGPVEDSSALYIQMNKILPHLDADHFEVDEKQRNVALTEAGQEKAESLLRESGILSEGGLYDIQNVSAVHHLNQALRAHKLFRRDTDYIVKDQKVIIIDEFTGRMMAGRRYSEGLHQALEAKENVPIQMENQTLASVTFQNYFRLYPKLAGMTGTAITEAEEFAQIYNLDVIVMPTNVPVARQDHEDEIYRTKREKMEAIAILIKECVARKQPILVGTVSIEKSEELSELLKKEKIKHNVLNARYHEQEAYIVSQAGVPGAVTIATNMAGRGTDIQLGGNLEMRLQRELADVEDDAMRQRKAEEIRAEVAKNKEIVLAAGGLYVIGTERHESRRIDNQLRGRSGRQGDPGASKFFLSLEDDLMRIFGGERMDTILTRFGLAEGEPLTHPWVSRALEKAQEKVENRNFEIRKQLLKFDDVMNDQRKVIYEQRLHLITADDVTDTIEDFLDDVVASLAFRVVSQDRGAEIDWRVLQEEAFRLLGLRLPLDDMEKEDGWDAEKLAKDLHHMAVEHCRAKRNRFGVENFKLAEKSVLLQVLDQVWKDHLLSLDHLRQGITLRAYGQRDPLNEYKYEAFSLFQGMLDRLREMTISLISHIEISAPVKDLALPEDKSERYQETRRDPALGEAMAAQMKETRVTRKMDMKMDPANPESWGRVPRNANCPCGSGKKYKHCHGQAA